MAQQPKVLKRIKRTASHSIFALRAERKPLVPRTELRSIPSINQTLKSLEILLSSGHRNALNSHPILKGRKIRRMDLRSSASFNSGYGTVCD